MATRRHPGAPIPRLPGEVEVARVYDASPQDEPPAALDAKILAAAHNAAQTPKRRAAFGARWAIPASVAAVMLLGIGVLLQMQESGLLEPRERGPVPASVSMETSPAPLTRTLPEQAPAKRLSKAAPASPPTTTQFADEMTARPDTATLKAQGMLNAPAREPEAAMAQAKAPAPAPATATSSASIAREHRAGQSKVGALEEKQPAARNANQQETDTMTIHAQVTAVRASGTAGAYQFSVTLRSPDTGCQQFADWWEVVSEDGKLLYRRVLLHSHVDEQPFTRSGGPVPIQASTVVWVRAHMNTSGYGGGALRGSVQSGFMPATPPADFAAHLATQAPLPTDCAF